jgi:hypothetical protein
MADQYSGDMIVGLDRVVAKTVGPYNFPQHLISLGAPQPGTFTLEIFEHINVDGWLPFVLFIEITRRLQGTNCKAMGVYFE